MNVTKLELCNFRNYKKIKFKDFKNLNIIIGNNATGKTTILEAIYITSITKSFKSSNEINLINYGKLFYEIKISLEDNKKEKKLSIFYNEKGKKTKVNGVLKHKLSDFISQFRVILFSPDELKIIKDSPNMRRNYINIQISQLNKKYLYLLSEYNLLIKQKNNILKKIFLNSNFDIKYLDIIDKKIANIGAEIYIFRDKYFTVINEYINKIYHNFKDEDEILVSYKSCFNYNSDKNYKILLKNRNKEINLGITSTGIHRDDYDFLINEKLVKEYASQGIQKIILLCFKLSEVELFIKDYNLYPILLLDDLFSELDILNKNKIIRYLNSKVQIFITTTDLNDIDGKLLKKANIMNLEEVKNERRTL